MKIAIRVDVDTLKGTQEGVPSIMRILSRHSLRAAFFFSAGPDNMGRNLWRLLNPQFAYKMMRTNAVGLYGPEIILQGTCWPGKIITKHAADSIRNCHTEGHEIGVHAWDHHAWQRKVGKWDEETIEEQIAQTYNALKKVTGAAPSCSAAPAWRCTEKVLRVKEQYAFRYNSDCRGEGVFVPLIGGTILKTPQIPQSLPTYDELIGNFGITNDNYNKRLLAYAREDVANLLTIHAEVEGGICTKLFEHFLEDSLAQGITFVSPDSLLGNEEYPIGKIVRGSIPGREGWASIKL